MCYNIITKQRKINNNTEENKMIRVIITLELEEEKFYAMEEILLNSGINKNSFNAEEWNKFVIEQYNRTEPYIECNNGKLKDAYEDMKYDF
jgi:hypothetical protein